MLQAGYQCEGLTMLLDKSLDASSSTAAAASSMVAAASSTVAQEDALAVCRQLRIKHRLLDLSDVFHHQVVEPFVSAYLRGETPNPCIDCNRLIKFGALLDYAREEGFDFLVTGHYARLDYDEGSQSYRLLKALDPAKDQSYVLYHLGQSELAMLRFPLGGLTKSQVRRIAQAAQLPTADKEESQDICFITGQDYKGFIHKYKKPGEGEIVDKNGEVLGYHQGISGFTIGQRRGIGIATGHPMYVTGIDALTNRITIGEEADLYHIKALLRDFTSPRPDRLLPVMEVQAKFRYRTAGAPARLVMFDDGRYEVQFYQPVKALTPGQSMVCYQDDEVVAGGVIAEVRG